MRGGFILRTRQNVPWIEVSKRNFPNIYKRLYERVMSLSLTWWPFQHLISSLLWSCYVCFGNAWKGTYHRNGVRLKHSTKPLLLSALFWIFFFYMWPKKNPIMWEIITTITLNNRWWACNCERIGVLTRIGEVITFGGVLVKGVLVIKTYKKNHYSAFLTLFGSIGVVKCWPGLVTSSGTTCTGPLKVISGILRPAASMW